MQEQEPSLLDKMMGKKEFYPYPSKNVPCQYCNRPTRSHWDTSIGKMTCHTCHTVPESRPKPRTPTPAPAEAKQPEIATEAKA